MFWLLFALEYRYYVLKKEFLGRLITNHNILYRIVNIRVSNEPVSNFRDSKEKPIHGILIVIGELQRKGTGGWVILV